VLGRKSFPGREPLEAKKDDRTRDGHGRRHGIWVIRSLLFLMRFFVPLDLAPQNVDALGILYFRSDCRRACVLSIVDVVIRGVRKPHREWNLVFGRSDGVLAIVCSALATSMLK
jgi:hypothetical protein